MLTRLATTAVVLALLLLLPWLTFSVSATVSDNQGEGEPLVLGLQGMIDQAIAEFPGLQAAKKATEVIREKFDEARHSWILPKIQATSLFGPVPDVPDGSGPPNFPEVDQGLSQSFGIFYRLEVEALQPIFTFGRLVHSKRVAEHGLRATQQDEQDQLHELIFNIKRAYFAYCALKNVETFLTDIETKLNVVQKRIQQLLQKSSPDITESDRLKVKVFRADLNNRQWENRNNQEKLRYALSLLMGFGDGVDRWRLKSTSLRQYEIQPFDMDSAMVWARNNNAKLKQLGDVVEIKRSLLKIAQGNLLPFLFLGGTFLIAVAPGRENQKNPFLLDPFNDLVGGVAIGARQPLEFHILRDRLQQRRAEYDQAIFQQRLAEDAIINEVRTSVIAADIAEKRMEALADGLRAARSWMGAELNNYEFGLVDTDDVLEAFIAFIKTKLEYISSMNRVYRSAASLTRVTFHELLPVRYTGDNR